MKIYILPRHGNVNERLFPLSVENNLGFEIQDASFFRPFFILLNCIAWNCSKLIEFINLLFYVFIYGEEGREGRSVIKDTRDNICEEDRNR